MNGREAGQQGSDLLPVSTNCWSSANIFPVRPVVEKTIFATCFEYGLLRQDDESYSNGPKAVKFLQISKYL